MLNASLLLWKQGFRKEGSLSFAGLIIGRGLFCRCRAPWSVQDPRRSASGILQRAARPRRAPLALERVSGKLH